MSIVKARSVMSNSNLYETFHSYSILVFVIAFDHLMAPNKRGRLRRHSRNSDTKSGERVVRFENQSGHTDNENPVDKKDVYIMEQELDVETLEEMENEDEMLDSAMHSDIVTPRRSDGRLIRPRKRRRSGDECIDYSAVRLVLPLKYYDRYKNQDYVRRNDISKYCHVCKKKTMGKFRSLPADLRLRKQWIIRFNLDAEQSAELWVKDNFSDGTHCGETCSVHFPTHTDHLKSKDILPIDMREPVCWVKGTVADFENDDDFDFDLLELCCVYCDRKSVLRYMIPFTRTRSRRYKWISALAGDNMQMREKLRQSLKFGATKFLCDWHFSDDDFEINTFGEWRLKKDVVPDGSLVESDKHAERVYMVNHIESTMSRNDEVKRRREELVLLRREAKMKERVEREHFRLMTDKLRRTYPKRLYEQPRVDFQHLIHFDEDYDVAYEQSITEQDRKINNSDYLLNIVQSVRSNDSSSDAQISDTGETIAGQSTSSSVFDYENVIYSDDSDDEAEALKKLTGEPPLGGARFCQVCSRVVSSERSMKEFRPRTWPFDELDQRKFVLRHRLTRIPATRFRLCVYHFSSESFMEKDDCIEFNEAALPLNMNLSEYEIIPRGPQGLIKWDKTTLKKGVEQLAQHPCKICRTHLSGIQDPYALIAERKLVNKLVVQCVQCSHKDLGANMIAFPFEADKKKMWIDALCREHWIIKGQDLPYQPLLIDRLDNNGVVTDVTYDEVCELLGEVQNTREHFMSSDVRSSSIPPEQKPLISSANKETEVCIFEDQPESVTTDELVDGNKFNTINTASDGNQHVSANDLTIEGEVIVS
uniref:THAP-type domain-containing protein n=1 Tax=Heterorhabditis bacteriophora TaxID=37862 RepID=A0A1I7X0Q4_HETBA